MKKLLTFILTLVCLNSLADTITLTVGITNTPANGATIANGSDVRTWTTGSVTTPATQIAVAANNILNASNLFYQVQAAPFTGMQVSWDGVSSNVVFTGVAPLSLTLSAGYATNSYVTNFAGPQLFVQVNKTNFGVGMTGMSASNQVVAASGIVAGITVSATNAFPTNTPALSNFVAFNGVFNGSASNAVITNATAISGNVAALSNGYWLNGVMTNGQNFGNPFRSPGTGTGSEQFGLGAVASASGATAIGDGATAGAIDATAYGVGANASGIGSTALGENSGAGGIGATSVGINSLATNNSTTAVGFNAQALVASAQAFGLSAMASNTDALAVGPNTVATNADSTALGYLATTTGDHQLMLGTASEYVEMPGGAHIGGNVTNLNTTGTNKLAGIIIYPSLAVTLVNGNNVLNPGTNSYIIITGPTAAFTIASIVGGISGRWLNVQNNTVQTMTSANNSGFDSTAANHIFNTPTGGGPDTNLTNGTGTYLYDGTQSRWILSGHN